MMECVIQTLSAHHYVSGRLPAARRSVGLRFESPKKNGFAARDPCATKPLLIQNNLQSAVLYASG